MKIRISNKKADVEGRRLAVDREFASVKDAKAFLNDEYTTGDWILLVDADAGVWVYCDE